MIYNNAIRSIRTKKKWDFKENIYNATMSYHQFQIFEKIGTEESQIDTKSRVNLLIKQNTYFLSNSPNDFIFSCTNISLALLYFGMPNNLRRLLLYAILNFLITVTVPLYHIVEHIRTERFEQSTFHIWGTLSKLPR